MFTHLCIKLNKQHLAFLVWLIFLKRSPGTPIFLKITVSFSLLNKIVFSESCSIALMWEGLNHLRTQQLAIVTPPPSSILTATTTISFYKPLSPSFWKYNKVFYVPTRNKERVPIAVPLLQIDTFWRVRSNLLASPFLPRCHMWLMMMLWRGITSKCLNSNYFKMIYVWAWLTDTLKINYWFLTQRKRNNEAACNWKRLS